MGSPTVSWMDKLKEILLAVKWDCLRVYTMGSLMVVTLDNELLVD
jgi:hypothetical protein